MNPFLVTVAVLLVAVTPQPVPVHENQNQTGSWNVTVSLVYVNGTNNTTVSSVVADILIVNSTNATLVENFTLDNGTSYDESDLGADLTEVTDVIIFPHNISQYPNASALPVDANVTHNANVSVTIAFSPWSIGVNTSSYPSGFPPPPNLTAIPLFIALTGVGIAALVAWIGYRGLRQMYSVFSNGKS